MIRVVWDHDLPPQPVLSEEDRQIASWDEWFSSVGLGEEWGRIKQACADTGQSKQQVIGWAYVVELTRLDDFVKDEAGVAK